MLALLWTVRDSPPTHTNDRKGSVQRENFLACALRRAGEGVRNGFGRLETVNNRLSELGLAPKVASDRLISKKSAI
eukprot:3600640-Prymnesium_polylepis.1